MAFTRSTQFRIDIDGDKEIADLLRTLEPKQVKPALRKGTRNGAKKIANKVRANAPQAEQDGGQLKKSIRVRALKRSRRWKETTGTRVISSSDWLDDDQFYANHIEFGTSKMAARPHWRPALKATADEAIDITRQAVIAAVHAVRAKKNG